MPEYPSNQRQPYAAAGADACEGVSEIVNANIFNTGKLANAAPFLVETVEMSFAPVRGKNPEVAAIYPASLFLKNFDCNPCQRYHLGSRLAGPLPQHAKIEIDLRPFQSFDLAATRAGKDE